MKNPLSRIKLSKSFYVVLGTAAGILANDPHAWFQVAMMVVAGFLPGARLEPKPTDATADAAAPSDG